MLKAALSRSGPASVRLCSPALPSPCARSPALRSERPIPRQQRTVAHSSSSSSDSPVDAASSSPKTEEPSLFAKVCTTLTNWFPLWVALGCFTALIKPDLYLWFASWVVPALALTMLGMGTTLQFSDFAEVLKQPYLVGLGALFQYTIMPTLGYVASQSFGLNASLAAGLILVSCCPGGTASNIVTYIARADVALSVLMTTASTFLACFATPVLTKAIVGTLVPVDGWGLFISTVQVVLLPVIGGMLLNRFFPSAVQRVSVVSPLIASLTVALICASVIAKNAATVMAAGPSLLGALVFLHMGGFLVGYFASRAMKLSERVSRTMSIEVGMQNSALGATLAMLHFGAECAAPCAISACMHSIIGSAFAGFWAFRDKQREQKGEAEKI